MSETNCQSILLLDDDQSALNALRRDLQDLDAELITTTDVHEALQVLEQRSISLVISDERMPLWNGCRFLALAEEISPATIRVLITGYTDLDVLRSAVDRAHVARYFLKPWDSDSFTSTIRELLDGSKDTGHSAAFVESCDQADSRTNNPETSSNPGPDREQVTKHD